MNMINLNHYAPGAISELSRWGEEFGGEKSLARMARASTAASSVRTEISTFFFVVQQL